MSVRCARPVRGASCRGQADMAVAHTEVWQQGTIAATRPLTPDIRRIEIDVPQPVRVEPGAHVDVRVTIGGEVEGMTSHFIALILVSRAYQPPSFFSQTTAGLGFVN